MIAGRILPQPKLAEPVPLDIRKAIARRVLLEMVADIKRLSRPIIVNLGIGIPSLVAKVALEEGIQDLIHVTIESGVWGGDPLFGPDFGASIGPYAIIPMPDQFSIYEGGVIDAASLGFLQVDRDVNVNPSMLPGRIPGPGGFPVIVTGAPKLYYAGAFTAGKRDIRVGGGTLQIRRDGDIVKFVERVYKSFCACRRLAEGREIMFITERAVFRVDSEGLVLTEIAPGVDLERDVLARMEFKPKIHPRVELMDKRIFQEGRLGVRDELAKALRA
jgi:acyl CoA:acetate/3-ketoacid CoA transferase